MGIYDVLEGDGACLVEWGDLFSDELGDERLDIEIRRDEASATPGAEPARLVRLTARGARAEELADALDAAVRGLDG